MNSHSAGQNIISSDEIVESLFNNVLDRRQFFLLHNEEGRVIKILAFPEFNPLPMFDEIAENRDLTPFFDMSQISRRDARGRMTVPGKVKKRYDFDFSSFYSNFPLHNLVTQAIGPNLFLARIAFSEFAPRAQLQNGLGIFFTDYEKDTLEGFEGNSLSLLQKNPEHPESLLGMPLSHFIHPTPSEFQAQQLAPFAFNEIKDFQVVWERNYLLEGPDSHLCSLPEGMRHEPGKGLLLESPVERHFYLRIPFIFDSLKNDAAVSVTCSRLKEAGAFLALGRETRGNEEPDLNGYMAGDAGLANRLFLKRLGFKTIQSLSEFDTREMITYTFCKIGKSVFLYANAERAFGYFDAEVLEDPKSMASFCLRPAGAVRVLDITLRLRGRPSNTQEKPFQHIAEVVQRPGHFCLLSRFQNNALSSSWNRPLAGYYPIDITTLESTIRRQAKQSQVMDTLLKNFETREVEFIGSSEPMQRIRETAKTAALSDATVLIEGPTGSGKEVLAHFIHGQSPRKKGPFIKVDCATIPKELIETTLFGYTKGAFTGASTAHAGLFEQAEGGTLFLDEAGNLSSEIQAKLLRFFNDFTITRVGGGRAVRVDVRCILASNRTLGELVEARLFRADLFYRIKVITLVLPALRERPSDVMELSHYYLHRLAALNGKPVKEFAAESLALLREHTWPGNIRELKNVIERAVVFAAGEQLTPELIRFDEEPLKRRRRLLKPRARFSLSKTAPERIREILLQHNGNVSAAAKSLGVGRVSLHLYLNAHNIRAKEFRKGF